MKTFIVANITSYIGQCVEAEHFYCTIYKNIQISIEEGGKELHRCRTSYSDKEELYKILTEEDAKALSNKDIGFKWRVGDEVNRFISIEEINQELLKRFPEDNIVTYYECQPHKEMLIKIDGEIKSIDFLGEVWSSFPESVWKDLLPENYKVKCECGEEYNKEEIQEMMLIYNYDERELVCFDIDKCDCCRRPYLMWNVIL